MLFNRIRKKAFRSAKRISRGRFHMIALNVTDIKNFMAQFLIGKTFDGFQLSEGSVTTYCTFSIDGTWQRDFLDPEKTNILADLAYTPWPRLKEYCFSIIKGKTTPLAFKFVFLLPNEKIPDFLAASSINHEADEIYGLYLNITYKDGQLRLTTGTSLRSFTMDRTIDNGWDLWIMSFLKKNGIATEQAG